MMEFLRDVFSSGKGVWRIAAGRYFGPPQSAAPTPSVDVRGVLFVVPGGAGVADALMFCRKNAADAYECATVDVTP